MGKLIALLLGPLGPWLMGGFGALLLGGSVWLWMAGDAHGHAAMSGRVTVAEARAVSFEAASKANLDQAKALADQLDRVTMEARAADYAGKARLVLAAKATADARGKGLIAEGRLASLALRPARVGDCMAAPEDVKEITDAIAAR